MYVRYVSVEWLSTVPRRLNQARGNRFVYATP